MKNDYLWDGRGEVDPEVARLEQLLGPFRHRRVPLDLTGTPRPAPLPRGHVTWRGPALLLALAATLLLLVRPTWQEGFSLPASSWTLELAAAPTAAAPRTREVTLKPNEWVVVDRDSRARLRAEDVGVVDVDPGSRVRVRADGRGLGLSVGVLHAQIWAPPGNFSVETPSTVAIDLGCAYTLEVDGEGASHLRVTAGWVGLAGARHEAFVPAGAVCTTTPGGVAGTPRRADAAPGFAKALDVLDGRTKPVHAAALDVVLTEATAQDAFSLWHLLTRLDEVSASRVYARLAELAPPPPAATRHRVLGRDQAALDAWWDSLGIGDTRWYRTYRARTR